LLRGGRWRAGDSKRDCGQREQDDRLANRHRDPLPGSIAKAFEARHAAATDSGTRFSRAQGRRLSILERHPRRAPGPQPCEASAAARLSRSARRCSLPVRFLGRASRMPAGSARHCETAQIGAVLAADSPGLQPQFVEAELRTAGRRTAFSRMAAATPRGSGGPAERRRRCRRLAIDLAERAARHGVDSP